MLRSLTASQFQEWLAFAELEPFGELRNDYRAATICQMVHNTQVKKEHQKPVSAFLLQFEESVKRQSWQEQKAYFLAMVVAGTGEAK